MNQLIFKQFEMTREYFIKNVESISMELKDVQPDGFNNTIHWHTGHVLTITEQTMFGFPNVTTHLPTNYIKLFGNGTKPADWTGNIHIPAMDQLVVQLKDQLTRLKQIPPEQLDQDLDTPFLGCNTVGELAGLTLMHEATHMGQIQAVKRMIEHVSLKN
ncbi:MULTISPECIES: DinB family protein [unclassified Bacillus (in: firmicutes)]|uniref:DinB family protein n=1 Tax=unclassified Bacillus (in: firmicutes) TaxID=185979 RepID=UPI001BEA3173|nr:MULTISPECIES: DinB family protein [unclassified Bacillus (in: firmicutes)]MBT2618445.1 DinB family protein [Bacillus sp. ISL-78]MBT2630690.1 DinB family protein [Bacillus sp. ISL-101]MBT2718763.1 DinB family protein [Bacillus sp. ISL-57]